MKVPQVKTPLGIIALFVAVIELFLAYPVTQLQGCERFLLVLFMTLFPFFVAALFFVVLWHKPLHLYSPLDIPRELLARFQEKAAEATASDVRLQELEEENRSLRLRATASSAAVLAPDASAQLAEQVPQIARSERESLRAEASTRIKSAPTADESTFEEAKRGIQESRQQSKRQRTLAVEAKMSNFRDWLLGRGFTDLPDIPTIVIEPSDFMNAYYSAADDSAHLGYTISEDSDAVAHVYFHVVLTALGVLSRFEGETAALNEGYCDYYACSYNGDPKFGERFAAALVEASGPEAAKAGGLSPRWIRNLEEEITLSEAGPQPHWMSVVWSGACWVLREQYGAEKVDSALHSTLLRLGSESSIGQAAKALCEELARREGEQAMAVVREVFRRRGVKIPE